MSEKVTRFWWGLFCISRKNRRVQKMIATQNWTSQSLWKPISVPVAFSTSLKMMLMGLFPQWMIKYHQNAARTLRFQISMLLQCMLFWCWNVWVKITFLRIILFFVLQVADQTQTYLECVCADKTVTFFYLLAQFPYVLHPMLFEGASEICLNNQNGSLNGLVWFCTLQPII